MSVFPDLKIIIVNWNLKEDTSACITSILEAGIETEQIILVDNASIDGSVEAIREQFGNSLKIFEAESNLGFAGGNNIGIQYALDCQISWLLLLNNDTVVDPRMFSELASAVQNAPKYGIVSPLIFYHAAPKIIWSAGDHLIPGTLATRKSYRNKQKPEGLPEILDVDFVTGSGMLVRKEVFEKIGLLDTSLFMYAEEIDFIWRARLAGYRVGCVTNAHLLHKVSLSANLDRPQKRYWEIRNQIYFYRKYARGLKLAFMFIIVFVRLVWMGTKDLIHGQNQLLSPLTRGWRDGWFTPNTLGEYLSS